MFSSKIAICGGSYIVNKQDFIHKVDGQSSSETLQNDMYKAVGVSLIERYQKLSNNLAVNRRALTPLPPVFTKALPKIIYGENQTSLLESTQH